MSGFVSECRRTWSRLGVPAAIANEMAADLAADLAEAQADGLSPEELLGNGFFDPKTFAASWATARGVAFSTQTRVPKTVSLSVRSLAVAGIALTCAAVALVGFLLLVGPRIGSASVAVATFRHPLGLPLPRSSTNPHEFFSLATGVPDALGWVFVATGFVGICITMWFWRPWASPRSGPLPDDDANVGMPSYL